MKPRYLVLAFLVSAVGTALVTRSHTETYSFHYDNVLGTSLDVTLRAASEDAARTADAALRDQIDRDARILSSYDADSEFSAWFRSENVPTRVSPELFTILSLFDGEGPHPDRLTAFDPNDAKQAADLLDRVDNWVEDGEVDQSAADLLHAALGPIAEQRGGGKGDG